MMDDQARLKALRTYDLLDTPPEDVFDAFTQMASKLFSAPIALISLIDEERQWFKAKTGLAVMQTPRDVAFCDHAIRQKGPMVVSDATTDPRFAENPLVKGDPKIRFYCGVPLRSSDGYGLGTLCIIDRVPRQMDRADLEVLSRLARLVEQEFETRRRLRLLEISLAAEAQKQQAKELLASMLVHDLRSPLTGIGLLGGVLGSKHPESHEMCDELNDLVEKMDRMLSDVLDVCLGQVGRLQLRCEPLLAQDLLREALPSWWRLSQSKSQQIVLDLPDQPVAFSGDRDLLTRVLTNLVGNAVQYGPSSQAIVISVRPLEAGGVRFEVKDQCLPVPIEAIASIFRPFERLDRASSRGRGLGLAFCHLAAEAHGGRVGVRPADHGNRFFLELPLESR